jgi:hypothetical protein
MVVVWLPFLFLRMLSLARRKSKSFVEDLVTALAAASATTARAVAK